jgi:hypothetical protein
VKKSCPAPFSSSSSYSSSSFVSFVSFVWLQDVTARTRRPEGDGRPERLVADGRPVALPLGVGALSRSWRSPSSGVLAGGVKD